MNKELEALKQLFSYAKSSASLCISQAYEDKKIIKSALTRLEKLEVAIELRKKLEKEFGYSYIPIMLENGNYEKYKTNYFCKVSQEEFNLIKEVFGK